MTEATCRRGGRRDVCVRRRSENEKKKEKKKDERAGEGDVTELMCRTGEKEGCV